MVLYYYCPTSRRWFCHSPTHHMVTYEKLADRDKKVYQIWKLTFEVIEIKMWFQKRFQPIVSAEQWEWQLGHKFDACILVLLHSFLRVFCILCSSQPPSSSKVLRKCQKDFFFFFFLSFSFLYFFNPTYRATSTLHPASYYYWAVRSYKSCVYSRKWGCSDAN